MVVDTLARVCGDCLALLLIWVAHELLSELRR